MRKKTRVILSGITALFLCLGSSISFAHHSFPVHFVPEGEVTVSGVVKSFRFANPHGVLELTVINDKGEEEA